MKFSLNKVNLESLEDFLSVICDIQIKELRTIHKIWHWNNTSHNPLMTCWSNICVTDFIRHLSFYSFFILKCVTTFESNQEHFVCKFMSKQHNSWVMRIILCFIQRGFQFMSECLSFTLKTKALRQIFGLPAVLIWRGVAEVMCVTAVTESADSAVSQCGRAGAAGRSEELMQTWQDMFSVWRLPADQTGWFTLWRYFCRPASVSDLRDVTSLRSRVTSCKRCRFSLRAVCLFLRCCFTCCSCCCCVPWTSPNESVVRVLTTLQEHVKSTGVFRLQSSF